MVHESRKHILFLAANARSLIANRGDLVREIQRRGHLVSAIIPEEDYLLEVAALGMDIHVMPLGRTGTNPLRDAGTVLRYLRLIRFLRPDIVYAYGLKPVVYGIPASKMVGVSSRFAMITGLGTVFIRPDTGIAAILRRIVVALYRNALAKAERVFFQNPDDIAYFKRVGILTDDSKAFRTMGSGVNLSRFERQPLPLGAPVFLFVGRLLREKGLAEFCDAAAIVKGEWPGIRFLAVGPHDPSLPHSVSVAELSGWKAAGIVEFVGGVADVRPYLRDCSVLVLPSYREGTPRSVLEAMATGRAIVTTDAPGCRETVNDGENGFLVPVGDAASLAAVIRRFLESPSLLAEMGEHSYRRVVSQYDVTVVNRQIIEVMGL